MRGKRSAECLTHARPPPPSFQELLKTAAEKDRFSILIEIFAKLHCLLQDRISEQSKTVLDPGWGVLFRHHSPAVSCPALIHAQTSGQRYLLATNCHSSFRARPEV